MNFAAARHNMVENQIRTNRVTDPQVIQAMEVVPRELFVPPAQKDVAYIDRAVELGGGRSLLSPMALARLLQTAVVAAEDVVLVVGAGTGYSAAVLSKFASTVVALESDADLSRQAASALSQLEVDTVAWVEGPLAEGYAKAAPYNVILVDGAVEVIPEALLAQLAEGGRLVAIVRSGAVGRAVLVTKAGGVCSRQVQFDINAPSLPGFAAVTSFAL